MSAQRTTRQNFGNWDLLNNLEHMIAILGTLVENTAVALEPKFILPVVMLAKDLNHSESQLPSLQNGYSNHCIELLGSNEFEPSIFFPP